MDLSTSESINCASFYGAYFPRRCWTSFRELDRDWLSAYFFTKSHTNASKEGRDFIAEKCRQSLNGMFVRNINVVTSVGTAKDKTWYFVNYDVNYYALLHLRHFNKILHLGHSNRLLRDVMKEIKNVCSHIR